LIFFVGLDLGQAADYTAVSVIEVIEGSIRSGTCSASAAAHHTPMWLSRLPR
jgi:hypothetical protein